MENLYHYYFQISKEVTALSLVSAFAGSITMDLTAKYSKVSNRMHL